MGNIAGRLQLISEDLKTSWYFRVWFLLWAFFALMTFVALCVLGARATRAQQHENWAMWIEKTKTIQFPDFNMRTALDDPLNQFSFFSCKFNDQVLVPTKPCSDGKTSANHCLDVKGSGFSATPAKNMIHCDIMINDTATVGDHLIAFQIANAGEFSFAYTWIIANNNAWVLLTKTTVKSKGHDEKIMWRRDLLYHSSVSVQDTFRVSVMMDTFNVFHYEEVDAYDRWMSVGDIGGFAFFLYILHTITMLLVGIFFENDSKFLRGAGVNVAEYQTLRT